jgi:hypothetical protein
MALWRKTFIAFVCTGAFLNSFAETSSLNQTQEVSPIYSPEGLPFTLDIETSSTSLPKGLQSYAFAVYKGKWLFVSGVTGGLHGFNPDDDNFPPNEQSTNIYVVDIKKKKTYTKSLLDKSSHLTAKEIEALSVVSPAYKQVGNTLYVIGGYGPDSEAGTFNTKQTLTAIDVPGLIRWVEKDEGSAKQNIRQTHSSIFQVSGGHLTQFDAHSPFLIIFGQNFDGYYTSESGGDYTEQVRTFRLMDNGDSLSVFAEEYKAKQPSYRRRDLNVIPTIQLHKKHYENGYMALSGVFTEEGGVWTVPVFIDTKGASSMPNPSKSSTFKQGMNNYNCACMGIFSKKSNHMHTILFGGLSYETVEDGTFTQDSEIPFTNLVTDVVIDEHGQMKQYLLDATYPEILSTEVNPGNPLLFGTGACFIPASSSPLFPNGVFSLDSIKEKTLVGYIVGGIQSTLPNTNTQADSAPSPYIFEVHLTPK